MRIKGEFFVAKGINVSSRIINGSAFIYLEDSRYLVEFSETATFIWKCISGSRTVNEIVEMCLFEYEGSIPYISRQIRSFLKYLFDEGFIVFKSQKFEGVMSDD